MANQKILIVDDEVHLVHILSFKLSQSGYELLTANNGQDGYELACQHQPDVVVTDFQMPVMDGFEMAKRLRANPLTVDIPLIMLTGRGHKISPEELAQTHIKIMMAKPFSANQLVKNVVQVLEDNKTDRTNNTNHQDHFA